MTCKQCGQPIHYVKGQGWQHVNSEITHDVVMHGKVEQKPPVELPLPSLDAVERGPIIGSHDHIPPPWQMQRIDEALHHYYADGMGHGHSWLEVRTHDQGRFCHCITCAAACLICQSRANYKEPSPPPSPNMDVPWWFDEAYPEGE